MSKWPEVRLSRKFPGLPRADHATGIAMDREYETYVPRSSLEEAGRKLDELVEAVEFEVGCMRSYAEEKPGPMGKLAGEIADPLQGALDKARPTMPEQAA